MSYSSDYNLIGQAFAEATAKEYDEELLRCKKSVSFSPSHARKMSEITGYRIVSPVTAKKILVILIAAVIFLVGCTAIIYHEEIGNFFITHFKVNSVVEVNEGEKTEITEEYDLSYVPDGYVLVYEQKDEIKIQKRWNDSFGNTLTFMQTVSGYSKYGFDSEMSNAKIEEHKGRTFFINVNKESCAFLWSENGYTFFVSIPSSIPENEVYKIIDSIIQF